MTVTSICIDTLRSRDPVLLPHQSLIRPSRAPEKSLFSILVIRLPSFRSNDGRAILRTSQVQSEVFIVVCLGARVLDPPSMPP